MAAGPSGIDRRARGRVVGLGGAPLPTLQRGIRGRGQSRRRHASSAETSDSAGRRRWSSRDHNAATDRGPGLCWPVARRRRSGGAAAGAPRALPLRAGPPTRRTAGDTGDGGGHGVAAGGGFRPAYWSGQSAPARRFRHHSVGRAWPSVHRGGRRARPGLRGTAHSCTRRRAGRAGAWGRSPVERPSGPWPRHVQACRPRRDCSPRPSATLG